MDQPEPHPIPGRFRRYHDVGRVDDPARTGSCPSAAGHGVAIPAVSPAGAATARCRADGGNHRRAAPALSQHTRSIGIC